MVSTLETRYNWGYNEIVTPTDMNNLGQTASALRLPDTDAAYLAANVGAATNASFFNISGLSCQITLTAQSRIRFLVGIRYTNGTNTQRNYFTVQYASSSAPSSYTNSFYSVFSADGAATTDGWATVVDNATANNVVNFTGVTPSLAAGTWILRPAYRSSASTVNILAESYMIILGVV